MMIGAISHDLRTPLNGVIVNLDEAYKHKETSDQIKETYLNPARMNCKVLMSLIDQFLNYTKENFNKELRMVYEKMEIQEIVEEMKAMFSLRA